jgi:hypothetical protein
MEQLQRDLEQRFPAGVQVPLDGTEEDAVASVRSQIIAMGAEPDDEAIAEIIRNVCNQ